MESDQVTLRCRYGIVTALPKEFAAVCAMLDSPTRWPVIGDDNDYVIGAVLAGNGRYHNIVATLLKKMGNNSAASAASNLLRSFPNVSDVLMV